MSAFVLVPVKEHTNAKSRLSGFLSLEERAMLARAMFEDVAHALAGLPMPVGVVTNSNDAARRAEALGWRILWETQQISESASVDAASTLLRREGISAVLRLPADLPLTGPADIEQILADELPPPFVALAPSGDRLGTNALLRSPPDLFPSRFGHNSFVLHVQEARRSQAQIRIVENSNLALDIDDASDLSRFLAGPSETFTYELLKKLKIGERIAGGVIA